MVSVEGWVIKLALFVVNLVFLATGFVFLYIGWQLHSWNDALGHSHTRTEAHNNNNVEVNDNDNQLSVYTAATGILVLGVVITAVAIMGFGGAVLNSVSMLRAYAGCIVLIMAVEIFLLWRFKNDNLEKRLTETVWNVTQQMHQNPHTFQWLEAVQRRFQCCGWNGIEDYNWELSEQTLSPRNVTELPSSCCGNIVVNKQEQQEDHEKDSVKNCTVDSANIHRTGCKSAIGLDRIRAMFGTSFSLVVVTLGVQLCLVMAACCLANEIRASGNDSHRQSKLVYVVNSPGCGSSCRSSKSYSPYS